MLFQDLGAVFPYRPHGKLWLVRQPKFAHHDHVEGSVQCGCDLKGDRHAAARQAQDHNVLATQFRQAPAELPAGVDPVLKNAHAQWLPVESSVMAPSVVAAETCAFPTGSAGPEWARWPLPLTIRPGLKPCEGLCARLCTCGAGPRLECSRPAV